MSQPKKPLAAFVVALSMVILSAGCGSDSVGMDGASGSGPNSPSTALQTQTTVTAAQSGPTSSGPNNEPTTILPPQGDLAAAKVKVQRLADFESPTVLTPRPGSNLLYVAERAGVVKHLDPDRPNTQGNDEPVLDISNDTTTDSERGLLGLAFSADGETLYVSHTNKDGNSRLAEYEMNGEVADPGSRRELFAVDQPFGNHNGGNVILGPDGMLWYGLGDGGAGDDPGNRAQNPDTPLGKLLRIDPSKPSDPEFWALGLRNPWRFSFDRSTGDLWIGDVGQNKTEEIDYLPAGTPAGTNFGWSGYEGSDLYLDKPERVPDSPVPPVFDMSHSDDWCSVTGGVVYRGKAIPDLVGSYLFGDYCKEGLHGLTLDSAGKATGERDLGADISQLVSINEDNTGEVYLLSLDGGVYRLEAA